MAEHDKYDWFGPDDFNRASPPCLLQDMDPQLMKMLDRARWLAKLPFIVTSAYRTVEHEKSQGRDGTSSHTKGLAIDLKATGSRQRFRIVEALIDAGFNRIGVGDGFIHVDIDPDKDPNVMFTYY